MTAPINLEAVFWDMDNTAVYTDELSRVAEQAQAMITAQRLGLHTAEKPFVLPEDWSVFRGWSRIKMANHLLGVDIKSAEAEQYGLDVAQHAADLLNNQLARQAELVKNPNAVLDPLEVTVKAYPGFQDCLDLLRGHNVGQGVVTSSRRVILDAMLPLLGVHDGYFRTTVAHTEGGRTKSHPDPYLTAMGRLAADPAHSVAVEDSASGVTAGRYSGAYTIGILTELPESRFATMKDKPNAVAQNHEHLAWILDGMIAAQTRRPMSVR